MNLLNLYIDVGYVFTRVFFSSETRYIFWDREKVDVEHSSRRRPHHSLQ